MFKALIRFNLPELRLIFLKTPLAANASETMQRVKVRLKHWEMSEDFQKLTVFLQEKAKASKQGILIDCSQVETIDEAAVERLFRLQRDVEIRGKRFAFFNVPEPILASVKRHSSRFPLKVFSQHKQTEEPPENNEPQETKKLRRIFGGAQGDGLHYGRVLLMSVGGLIVFCIAFPYIMDYLESGNSQLSEADRQKYIKTFETATAAVSLEGSVRRASESTLKPDSGARILVFQRRDRGRQPSYLGVCFTDSSGRYQVELDPSGVREGDEVDLELVVVSAAADAGYRATEVRHLTIAANQRHQAHFVFNDSQLVVEAF